MTSIFLASLVVLINLFIYSSHHPQGYEIVMHLYYGIMILAGKYSGRYGQGVLVALTTFSYWLYIALYYDQMHNAGVTTVVATVYPFIALFIVRTLRISELQRNTTEEQLQNLGSQVRDLSTLFEVGKAANAAMELDELFQEIMKTLTDRMGVYRGTLRIWKDGKRTRTMGAVFGLTKAELRRGTDSQIHEIQRKVLDSGQAIGVPHTRKPLRQLDFPDATSVQSKDSIAFWCIPVIVDEQVVATLTVDKASDEFSAEDDLRILTIIASILGQRVKIQEMIDSLVQSERLATLGKLATTVAHEVRNPLGGIRGAAQLLELRSESDPETKKYIAIIIKEVDRLNRVIEQLLTFGKGRPTNFKLHNLHEIVENSLSICQPDMDQNRIRVEYTHWDDCPLVVVDADGLTQVLLNLFRNAIESMQNGGVLTIQTQRDDVITSTQTGQPLSETEELEKQTVQIRVQDTGPGISPDVVPYLFDPFYTTKQKGTGLGLALSHEVIEEHGGTIEVDSKLAQGTAFVIILPI